MASTSDQNFTMKPLTKFWAFWYHFCGNIICHGKLFSIIFLNIQSLRLKLWTNLQIASFSSFANVLLMSLPMCLKIKMRKVQYTNYFVSQFIISCHCLKLTAKYRLHVCAAKWYQPTGIIIIHVCMFTSV